MRDKHESIEFSVGIEVEISIGGISKCGIDSLRFSRSFRSCCNLDEEENGITRLFSFFSKNSLKFNSTHSLSPTSVISLDIPGLVLLFSLVKSDVTAIVRVTLAISESFAPV